MIVLKKKKSQNNSTVGFPLCPFQRSLFLALRASFTIPHDQPAVLLWSIGSAVHYSHQTNSKRVHFVRYTQVAAIFSLSWQSIVCPSSCTAPPCTAAQKTESVELCGNGSNPTFVTPASSPSNELGVTFGRWWASCWWEVTMAAC